MVPSKLNFENVWEDLLEVARMKESIGIHTLTKGVLNQIVSVSNDAIVVRSEKTGKERVLMKEDFRCLWELLRRRRRLDVDDMIKHYRGNVLNLVEMTMFFLNIV